MRLKKIKKHLLYISLILILSLFFVRNIISSDKIMNNVHYINDITFVSNNFKENVFKYGTLHLWTPYYYSGRPLYAQPEYYFIDLNAIYILLFRNIFLAMNLALMSYLFIAGLGMYFLFLHFKPNNKAALIASILYMFNGFTYSFVFPGNLMVLEGYALIPFIFLFFSKALKQRNSTNRKIGGMSSAQKPPQNGGIPSVKNHLNLGCDKNFMPPFYKRWFLTDKNYIFYSILASLFLTLQIFAGGAIFLLYTALLIGIYTLFYLVGKDFKNRLKRVILVVLIFAIFSFGLSAIKLLPGMEFLELSNRSGGVSYQEYLGNPIQLKDIGIILTTNLIQTKSLSAAIGFIGFFLFLFSLIEYKKKRVLFFVIILLFSIIMAIKSPLADIFYYLPFFNKLRHIERALVIAAFSLPILSGFGYLAFLNKIKKALKYEKFIFLGIIALIVSELLLLQTIPAGIKVVKPTDIPIIDYIGKDKTNFRTINLALSTLVGASGYNYLSQLGIGTLKGGSGIWFNDYLEYLAVAQQYNPGKLWGILNAKYITANQELNIPNLKFVKKFSDCRECPLSEAWGPYLYENQEFLPRAYIVNNSILVLGADKNIIYSLLLNKDFEPKNAVIIAGRNIEDYALEELNKYKLVILNKNVGQSSLLKLKNYVGNGGIILPDIFNNKNEITNEDIENALSNFKGNISTIEIAYYSPNKIKLNVNSKKGFLVLSERYAYFPGWEAKADNLAEFEILKANNAISSVYLDGNADLVTFQYKPKTFKYGALVSLISLFILAIFFSVKLFTQIKKQKNENK